MKFKAKLLKLIDIIKEPNPVVTNGIVYELGNIKIEADRITAIDKCLMMVAPTDRKLESISDDVLTIQEEGPVLIRKSKIQEILGKIEKKDNREIEIKANGKKLDVTVSKATKEWSHNIKNEVKNIESTTIEKSEEKYPSQQTIDGVSSETKTKIQILFNIELLARLVTFAKRYPFETIEFFYSKKDAPVEFILDEVFLGDGQQMKGVIMPLKRC